MSVFRLLIFAPLSFRRRFGKFGRMNFVSRHVCPKPTSGYLRYLCILVIGTQNLLLWVSAKNRKSIGCDACRYISGGLLDITVASRFLVLLISRNESMLREFRISIHLCGID